MITGLSVTGGRPASAGTKKKRVAVSSSPAQRATFRDVFTVREFRALWLSQILSAGGDRLALVALALLIYDRTRLPLLAAIAYAAGTLPYLSRRAVPVRDGRPLPAPGSHGHLRRGAGGAGSGDAGPADAAGRPHRPAVRGNGLPAAIRRRRSAILRDMVQGERYALAAATMQSTFLTMVVAGAAVGGLTVALLGARPALGFDAATFVVSALLIKFGVLARPAAATSVPNALRQLGGEVRVVFGDRALRILLTWPRTSRPRAWGAQGAHHAGGRTRLRPARGQGRRGRPPALPATPACRWIPTATCALGRTVTASAMLSEPSGCPPPQSPPRDRGDPSPRTPLGGAAPPPHPPRAERAALELLASGELEVEGRLVDASNATLYCTITVAGPQPRSGKNPGRPAKNAKNAKNAPAAETKIACVYKPIAGERPFWDFPAGRWPGGKSPPTVSRAAAGPGPAHVMRDGPFGDGMVQLWIDTTPRST